MSDNETAHSQTFLTFTVCRTKVYAAVKHCHSNNVYNKRSANHCGYSKCIPQLYTVIQSFLNVQNHDEDVLQKICNFATLREYQMLFGLFIQIWSS